MAIEEAWNEGLFQGLQLLEKMGQAPAAVVLNNPEAARVLGTIQARVAEEQVTDLAAQVAGFNAAVGVGVRVTTGEEQPQPEEVGSALTTLRCVLNKLYTENIPG